MTAPTRRPMTPDSIPPAVAEKSDRERVMALLRVVVARAAHDRSMDWLAAVRRAIEEAEG